TAAILSHDGCAATSARAGFIAPLVVPSPSIFDISADSRFGQTSLMPLTMPPVRCLSTIPTLVVCAATIASGLQSQFFLIHSPNALPPITPAASLSMPTKYHPL